jgi:putative transposase
MKPNTFTKLYVHCIFTPKGRESLMESTSREKIQKYIYGIIKGKKCYPIAINGTEDHLHILTGFIPTITISDLVRDIKRSSSLYINENGLVPGKFQWQEGFGAFTVGYKELDKVYKYILNQENHHMNQSFKNEYKQILDDEGFTDFEEYMFEFYDND